MRLFGGILPFIGWRQVWVDNDGSPCCGPAHFYADVLEWEWFGHGAVFYVGKVYPASHEGDRNDER